MAGTIPCGSTRSFYFPVQPSSIYFLRTTPCVACVNSFEIIDPEALDTQGLLDASDESLHIVRCRSDNTHPKPWPVAIYCIENEFYCATMSLRSITLAGEGHRMT